MCTFTIKQVELMLAGLDIIRIKSMAPLNSFLELRIHAHTVLGRTDMIDWRGERMTE